MTLLALALVYVAGAIVHGSKGWSFLWATPLMVVAGFLLRGAGCNIY